MATVTSRSTRPHSSAGRDLDAALALRQLLNPVKRGAIAGMPRRRLVVAAVWPDGPGFSARLEAPNRPGVPVAWVRWQDGLEVWRFPEDPELPALGERVSMGYEPLGHRLGRRATLRPPEGDGAHVLHLRPARVADATFQRWAAIHATLESAGVPVARLGRRVPETHGLEVEWIRGEAAADFASQSSMSALGEVLARAHAAAPPPGLPVRGPGPSLDATVRQVGMAVHSGTAFTQWLERRLERWRLLGATPRSPGRALVHGDLHAGHVAWREGPVLVDWDRGGLGNAEEDLGSLAAHLFRESGPDAAAAFAAFRAAYTAAGGAIDQVRFEYYARLSLVRLLAILALCESAQPRLRTERERWATWPEVVSGW